MLHYYNITSLCMQPADVVLVASRVPENRRFYKEIIAYQAELFCVVTLLASSNNHVTTAMRTETKKLESYRFLK